MIKIDEYLKYTEEQRKQAEIDKRKKEEDRIQKLKDDGLYDQYLKYNKTESDFYGDCDSIYTMENSTATVLYIAVMLIGAIFKSKLIIWGVATIIYFKFITRHNKRK